ncbi:MAG TPA: hypothetical protein VEX40_18395, partial [Mycobacterium sp.]|nr:hypothetical protein [Mycobacterium sp.]
MVRLMPESASGSTPDRLPGMEQKCGGGNAFPAGQQRTDVVDAGGARSVENAVGVEGQDGVDVGGGRHADRIPTDERADVHRRRRAARVHLGGSLKGALKAADAGVDALVVEGVEGGGFKSALRLDDGVVAVGRTTDLYFEGDLEASVANTGQVSSRITDLRP